ncbi:MAG: hypothetical protein LBC99_07660 [Spirochaetota bacterium]|jgi:hypothetical protein|nr:hypothetical protein [Spirochaetota bacterium]
MGYDDEVSVPLDAEAEEEAPVESHAHLFFREIQQSAEKPALYSLEDEFSKTKRQKNTLFYAGFFLFLIALVVLAFIVTNNYQRRSSEIQIEVSDFRDLHLADVLEHTKKDEGRINRLRREIADLRSAQQTERQKVRARFTAERDILALRDFSDDEEREEAALLLAREERNAFAATDARFAAEIRKRDEEISEIQQRLSEQNNEGQASGADLAFESALQVRELESKRLDETWQKRIEDANKQSERTQAEQRALAQRMADSLILRYNPVFREQNLLALLPAGVGGQPLPALPQFSSFSATLAGEIPAANSMYGELQQSARDGRMLLKRVYDTGYTNSIAPALFAAASRENTLINGYEALWQSMENRLVFRNAQTRALVNALDLALQQAKIQGYVVDAGNPSRLFVVLSSKLNLGEYSGANVIRAKDNKRIGGVYLESTRDGVYAIPADTFTQAAESMDRLQLIKK